MKKAERGYKKYQGISSNQLFLMPKVYIGLKLPHKLVKFKYIRLTVINKVSTKLGYYLFCHTQIRHRHYQTMFCVIKLIIFVIVAHMLYYSGCYHER